MKGAANLERRLAPREFARLIKPFVLNLVS